MMPGVIFVLVFFSPLSIAITSLGEETAILVLFVRLLDSRLFGFVCFLFLLVSGKGCCGLPPNVLGRAIVILNFARRFRNFIADTVPWKKNITSVWMAMSPDAPHMGYTYLNLLDSPELLQILVTNYRNKVLTAKLLRQSYRYFKLRKAFRNFIADTVPS